VYRAEVDSALDPAVSIGRVEVYLFLRVSSVAVDSLRCHFGKEGIQMGAFEEELPGVFVSPSSPFDAQETEHHASSLLGPRRVLS
jgi:hypothetical protein